MFAYGSTPPFASDPFFTRGVSAKTLELIKSPERQKTHAGNPNFKKFPAVLRDGEGELQAARRRGDPVRGRHGCRPAGTFPGSSSTGSCS